MTSWRVPLTMKAEYCPLALTDIYCYSKMSPVLTNPMAACSSLQVILRVEVAVYENYRVSSRKVQAHSPCKDSLLGSQHTCNFHGYYLHAYLLTIFFPTQLQEFQTKGDRKLGLSLLSFTLCIHHAERRCWPIECHPAPALISVISQLLLWTLPQIYIYIRKACKCSWVGFSRQTLTSSMRHNVVDLINHIMRLFFSPHDTEDQCQCTVYTTKKRGFKTQTISIHPSSI